MVHELKTWDEFMIDVAYGIKPFEVRKNDRNFQQHDTLLLQGWRKASEQFTGRVIEAEVTYILHGGQFGIEDGFCVMGIKVKNHNL